MDGHWGDFGGCVIGRDSEPLTSFLFTEDGRQGRGIRDCYRG